MKGYVRRVHHFTRATSARCGTTMLCVVTSCTRVGGKAKIHAKVKLSLMRTGSLSSAFDNDTRGNPHGRGSPWLETRTEGRGAVTTTELAQ